MKYQRLSKPELLAPAGNFEKLEIAVHYGADAVYLAGKDFSLRNFSGNFTLDEMSAAIAFAHQHNVKVYVACNIYPRNHEISSIAEFLAVLGPMGPDGVIVSDPGVLNLALRQMPHVPIHLSTQANTTNRGAVKFWDQMGVRRVNVARELTLKEIKTISGHTSLEIEAFVHGAMCMAYSGRCLLSSFMAQRDSNRGMCCHPCRFQYTVVEEKRPGQYYDVRGDHRGSYIFNSRDLCMIEHIPDMMDSGITSLKIEGRMKGIHYLATVVKTYREAIDAFCRDPSVYQIQPQWVTELAKVSHRGYSTGFYLGDPDQVSANFEGNVTSNALFLAKILNTSANGEVRIDVRNRIAKNDTIEILSAQGPLRADTIMRIMDENHQEKEVAHPGSRVTVALTCDVAPNDIIRRIQNERIPASLHR